MPTTSACLDPSHRAGRVPGTAAAVTVLVVELLAGTRIRADVDAAHGPTLVIDTGPTELHLRTPAVRMTIDDLATLDQVITACAELRLALISYLD